jgi:glycosyltransferase involved in cell wall biosynthesis
MSNRVCLVSQRTFAGDPRLSTQIQSLRNAGYSIDAVCVRGKNQPFHSVENGIRFYRIPSMDRKRQSKLRYVVEYASFFIPAFFLLAFLQIIRGYRVVHVTNLPDLLLFAAAVPKLLGAKLIFDVRECTPEMFIDRFGASPQGRTVRIMTAIEQACIKFANATITCTEQMRQALIKRGGAPDKLSVMMNMPVVYLQREPKLPDPTDEARDEFRLITHGTVIRRYGHELLVDAMAEVVKEAPQVHLDVFGKGEILPDLDAQIKRLKLEANVKLWGYVSEDELVRHLRAAHCGVVPILQNPESDLVHTHKMFEYIHLGIPTITSRTTAVAAYFTDDSLRFYKPNDAHALAEAIIELAINPQKRYDLASHALTVYENYAPEKQYAVYASLVARLINQNPPVSTTPKLEMGREN